MLILTIITTICFVLIIAGCITDKTTTTNEVVRVLHDKASVHLSYNGYIIKTYNDVATYTYLSDKEEVTVTRKKNLNMYGGLIAITWELPSITQ